MKGDERTFANHPERQFMQYLRGSGWINARLLLRALWRTFCSVKVGSNSSAKARRMKSTFV